MAEGAVLGRTGWGTATGLLAVVLVGRLTPLGQGVPGRRLRLVGVWVQPVISIPREVSSSSLRVSFMRRPVFEIPAHTARNMDDPTDIT